MRLLVEERRMRKRRGDEKRRGGETIAINSVYLKFLPVNFKPFPGLENSVSNLKTFLGISKLWEPFI